MLSLLWSLTRHAACSQKQQLWPLWDAKSTADSASHTVQFQLAADREGLCGTPCSTVGIGSSNALPGGQHQQQQSAAADAILLLWGAKQQKPHQHIAAAAACSVGYACPSFDTQPPSGPRLRNASGCDGGYSTLVPLATAAAVLVVIAAAVAAAARSWVLRSILESLACLRACGA